MQTNYQNPLFLNPFQRASLPRPSAFKFDPKAKLPDATPPDFSQLNYQNSLHVPQTASDLNIACMKTMDSDQYEKMLQQIELSTELNQDQLQALKDLENGKLVGKSRLVLEKKIN